MVSSQKHGYPGSWEFINDVLHKATRIYIPPFSVKKRSGKAIPWWSVKSAKEGKMKHRAWKPYARQREEDCSAGLM